jgi:hypothetical protein
MKILQNESSARILLLGDLAAIGIAVWIGLQFHQLGETIWQRFPFTFVPWSLAWYFVAAKFDLLHWKKVTLAQVGQILMAMIIASPLAAMLRAAWLGTAALPLFALIMGAVTAFAIIVWRLIYSGFPSARPTANG